MLQLTGILLSLAIGAFAQGASRCTAMTIKNERDLWIGDQRVIRDDLGINAPRWSPDGQKLAYVNDFNLSSDPVSHLVVIDRSGHVLQTVPIPESAMFNFVDEMGWLNPTTIWIDGHVSPSAGMYAEFDLATREMRHETPGLFFSPSPDGRTLAYCEPGPRPARPDYFPPLMLNETAVPLPEKVSIRGPLVWSPTGHLLAVGVQKEKHSGVAFLTARGMMERVVMLPVDGRPDAVVWTDNASVLVRSSGPNGTYRVGKDGTVEQSKAPLRAAAVDDACRPTAADQ